MITIAKTSNRAKRVFQHATKVVFHCRENYYIGALSTPERAEKALHQYSFAKLKDEGNGKFCVRVHGAAWYDLESQPDA